VAGLPWNGWPDALEQVVGFTWNQWPLWPGMGGRLAVEPVAGLSRNTHRRRTQRQGFAKHPFACEARSYNARPTLRRSEPCSRTRRRRDNRTGRNQRPFACGARSCIPWERPEATRQPSDRYLPLPQLADGLCQSLLEQRVQILVNRLRRVLQRSAMVGSRLTDSGRMQIQ
jgi:hypothetical protein